jgi:hypothetical protein
MLREVQEPQASSMTRSRPARLPKSRATAMIAECPVSVIVSSGQLSELGCDRWMETGSCRLGVGPAIGWFRRPRCLNDHVRGALSGQRFDMWSGRSTEFSR